MFLRINIYSFVKFANRTSAGLALVSLLKKQPLGENVYVVGLARGGVVVAKTIATAFSFPLDVLVVKKIGSPTNTELAIGAITSDNVRVVHWPQAHRSGADEHFINQQSISLEEEISKKTSLYRRKKKFLVIEGKIVLLVDDGVATGATLEAAIFWARKKRARRILVAVPVAPTDTISRIRPEIDDFIAVEKPSTMNAVGEFYEQFPQVSDEEVIQLLA